jgi:hypothetical protein
MREKFYTTNLPPEAKRLISSILQIYRRRACVNIYTLKIYRLFKQRIQAQTMKMGRIFKKCFFQILRQSYGLILQKLFFYAYHKFPKKS